MTSLNTAPFDEPYSLRDIRERRRRVEMLVCPHMRPLAHFVTEIRSERGPDHIIPDFDPYDGGVAARALFLLEAPGPQATASAFISSNNPDPTARNLWHLMHDAELSRRDVLLWNIVPWYVGSEGRIRPVNSTDISQAMPYLKTLITLLPGLELIVLIGRKAQSARDQIQSITDIHIMQTCHMSQRVFSVWPHKKRETQEDFHAFAHFLKQEPRDEAITIPTTAVVWNKP